MRIHRRVACLVTLGLVLAACEREPAAKPPPTPPAPAPGTAANAQPEAAAPAKTPEAAHVLPEDRTLDAERDPRLRERAVVLKAIRPEQIKYQKPGEEVVVLVRGDRGGGALYGSGPYTADSSIRRAAVHHGALRQDELGLLKVKFLTHDGDHPAAERNGVQPNAWGKYHLSYTLEKQDER